MLIIRPVIHQRQSMQKLIPPNKKDEIARKSANASKVTVFLAVQKVMTFSALFWILNYVSRAEHLNAFFNSTRASFMSSIIRICKWPLSVKHKMELQYNKHKHLHLGWLGNHPPPSLPPFASPPYFLLPLFLPFTIILTHISLILLQSSIFSSSSSSYIMDILRCK